MDCSLPGSSVHGIFQAIVLEWIAISSSRGSSQPRDRTCVSRIVDRRFAVSLVTWVKFRCIQYFLWSSGLLFILLSDLSLNSLPRLCSSPIKLVVSWIHHTHLLPHHCWRTEIFRDKGHRTHGCHPFSFASLNWQDEEAQGLAWPSPLFLLGLQWSLNGCLWLLG